MRHRKTTGYSVPTLLKRMDEVAVELKAMLADGRITEDPEEWNRVAVLAEQMRHQAWDLYKAKKSRQRRAG